MKKIISLLLTIVLLAGTLPLNVFAANHQHYYEYEDSIFSQHPHGGSLYACECGKKIQIDKAFLSGCKDCEEELCNKGFHTYCNGYNYADREHFNMYCVCGDFMTIPIEHIMYMEQDMSNICQDFNIEIANNKGDAREKLHSVVDNSLIDEHPHSGYYHINGHEGVYLERYYEPQCKFCIEELCVDYDTHTYLYEYDQYDTHIIATCFCGKRMKVQNEYIDDFIDEQRDLVNNSISDENLKSLQYAEEEKQRRENSYISMGFDSWPVSLYEDNVYHLEGAISSDFVITSVEATILNGNGDIVISTYDTPNSFEVDITTNSYCNLPFEQLAPGTYQLVVTANNEADKIETISDYFTIVELPEESTLDINFTEYPDTITQGNSSGLRGSITSNYNIENVYGYVLDSNGDVVLSSHDTPNTKSVDIRSINLNNSLKFGKLSVGSYVLRTVAEDAMMQMTLDIDFEVVKKPSSAKKQSSVVSENLQCTETRDGMSIEDWERLYGPATFDSEFPYTVLEVKTTDATVHMGPLEASNVIANVPRGTYIPVIGRCVNQYNHIWYRVSYAGQKLYMYSGELGEVSVANSSKTDRFLSSASNTLTALSLVPGVDSVADALAVPVDLARGDIISAGLSLAGVIPFVGEAADATKTARLIDKSADSIKAVQKIDDIGDAAKIANKLDAITDIKKLPANVQEAYSKYSKQGWKGVLPGATKGTKAGGAYENVNKMLPIYDQSGRAISYREFDVNNKIGVERDAERFVVGSNNSVYYTMDHYKTFVKIK